MSEKAPALCLHLRILHTFHIRARAMNAEQGAGGGGGGTIRGRRQGSSFSSATRQTKDSNSLLRLYCTSMSYFLNSGPGTL